MESSFVSVDHYIPKYFRDIEFNLCVPHCERTDMDSDFLRKLDRLRELCDFPIVLNSAYRNSDWEKSHGRSGRSMHTDGRAVDIKCYDPHKRAEIVHNAIYAGFGGIGIGKNFIHVDDRLVLTMWTYYE